ncbi:XRE family transcriptional regulator [Nocardioides dubius]|uniref:XRE family transcriptional regulator n=1 Tax=Nocardioides dubius TaxID=317019 RepID=A0ABN1TUN3_9ACTN
MTERGGRGRSWEAVKRDAIAAGLTSNERIEEAGEQAKRELRAYRLAEIRKRSAATQRELAARMHVTQGRVSQIESGQLESSELGTLRSYVEALGGSLRVVADFGDVSLTIVD